MQEEKVILTIPAAKEFPWFPISSDFATGLDSKSIR